MICFGRHFEGWPVAGWIQMFAGGRSCRSVKRDETRRLLALATAVNSLAPLEGRLMRICVKGERGESNRCEWGRLRRDALIKFTVLRIDLLWFEENSTVMFVLKICDSFQIFPGF